MTGFLPRRTPADSPSRPICPSLSTRLRHWVSALLAVACLATVGSLSSPVGPAAAVTSPTAGSGAVTGRGDGDPSGLDVPKLPPHCFAPYHSTPTPGPCFLNHYRARRPTVVIWGDSHAWQMIPGFEAAGRHRDVNLVSFVAGSCPPVLIPIRADDEYPDCERNDVLAVQWLEAKMAAGRDVRLIIGANWDGYLRGWQHIRAHDSTAKSYSAYTKHQIRLGHRYQVPLFRRLAHDRIPTDVISQAATVPDTWAAHHPCANGDEPYRCDLPRRVALPDYHSVRQWLRRYMAPMAGNPRLIDTTSTYCGPRVCHGQVGSITTFFNDLHLSATRTATFGPFFATSIDAAIAARRAGH